MNSKRGFTLVELLVVLGIAGILSAVLLPVIGSALDRAKASQSMNNLRQLVSANISHAADHGFYAPADDRWNNRRWHGARGSAGQLFDPTKGFLSDYLGKSRKVSICPLFKDMIKGTASFEEGTGGYGYNAAYIGGLPTWEWNPDGSRKSATPAQIVKAETVMFTTSGYANGNSIQEYPYSEPPFWDFGSGPSGWRPSPSVHFRANDKALVGWCDGRVSMETCEAREVGFNPHGGDARAQKLGWIGPDEQNGFWNPRRGN